MTIKATLWEMMDSLPAGQYGLWTLTDTLNQKTGHRTMPHTVCRYAKEYADAAGAEFYCVVHNESIYQYEPGYKIAGAYVDA
jgi:ribosomal protein L32